MPAAVTEIRLSISGAGFSVGGAPGEYRLEKSGDLRAWAAVRIFTITGGSLTLPLEGTETRGFFRVAR